MKKNKGKKVKNKVSNKNKEVTKIFSVVNKDGVLEIRFERGVISEYYSSEQNFLDKVNNDEVLDNMLKRICEILLDGDKSKNEIIIEAAESISNSKEEKIDDDTINIIEKMKETMNESIERSYNPKA